MKHFFYVVFGGLTVMLAVSFLMRLAPAFNLTRSVAVADGTIVSGFHRMIRYTAFQEENLIDDTVQTLPTGTSVTPITAQSYIVKDLTTGSTTASLAPTRLLPIASLTKLVTAVIARRLIPATSRITITQHVIATYGNTASFTAGETFSASDLLYPLLMVSSNDAAEAYAQYYGRADFIKAMNEFTQSIGAYRTYFADPSGLDPSNVSTVSDIALIIDWIRLHDPTIIDVTSQKSVTIRSHTWVNPTHLLNWSYYIGGKNGYLPEAKDTGVSLFVLGPNKDVYVIAVLDSSDRDGDVIKLLKKVPQ